MGRIPRAEDNGWSASMDENNKLMGELRDAIKELAEEQAGGGGGGGNFLNGDEWSKVRVSLVLFLLTSILILAGTTFLTARDNESAIETLRQNVERLENWQRAHVERHP